MAIHPVPPGSASANILLPLFPEGLSPVLRTTLIQWRDAYQTLFDSTWVSDEADPAYAVEKECSEAIISFSAATMGDIAAKLSLGLFHLNGAATADDPGITENDELEIRADYAVDGVGEMILLSTARDAARLARSDSSGG